MKNIHRYLSLILLAALGVILTECQPKKKESFVLEHNYDYTIKASMFNLGGGSTFELRPARMRRDNFRKQSNNPEAIMYAYHLMRPDNEPESIKEVAISKQQADRLFTLAKAVFNSIQVSNVDTIYKEPEEQIGIEQDRYSYGEMTLITHYSNVKLEVGTLWPDKKQTPLFNALCEEFKTLFN